MKTDKMLKKINNSCPEINVNKNLDITPKRDDYFREFNRGKSFSFTEWSPITKYTNDDFKQDFVSYKTALLACKRNHISSDPPVLLYDEHGMPVATTSDEWHFVFASGIAYNTYYLDLQNADLGEGLAIKDNNVLYANAGAVTTEEIKVGIDLGGDIKAGDVIPIGTPIQELLNEVFSSTRIGRGDGIPFYTPEMVDKMSPEDIPDTYVEIPSESELYETDERGSYLSILFASIRKLQAEVSRLRNSFKYGINSYNNQNVAMSEIIDSDVKEEEPLWSIEQSDLSGIPSAMFDFETGPFTFKPIENYIVKEGKLEILDDVYFDDPEREIEYCLDPKLYLYTTSSDLNIKYTLTNEYKENIIVDLKELVNVENVNKYNVLLMVSRKTKQVDDSDYHGYNYVWLSIGNYETNEILAEGYYNFTSNTISENKQDFGRCVITKVTFGKMNLYKFDTYSKYQDFSEEVNPSTPSDQDYKYNVAHITIRAVKNYNELKSIESLLPNNELVWDEGAKKLYIKSKDTIVPIGSASDSDNNNTGMGETDIIEMLQKMGIAYFDNEGKLQLSKISDATFINSDTGKSFKFEVSPEGELVGNEIPEKTLSDRINNLKNSGKTISEDTSYRGFIARLLCAEQGKDPFATSDVGQCADRVLITSVYCPLASDTKFGCTHGFVELENTTNSDIPLEGCYLHFLRPSSTTESGFEVIHLPLKGVLKSGSTYLVRCKKYADVNLNADVVINVDSYDQEWYVNGELLDLSISDTNSAHGFALTYSVKDINENTTLWTTDTSVAETNKQQVWKWYYIDSLVFNNNATNATWADQKVSAPSNSIVKRTFSLDPAKQAFTATTLYDSSRYRNANTGTDIQIVDLSSKVISFPHSDYTYPIENYTPKSSKLRKNVSTDKTKLDMERPNMVTCSFGINAYTTRCFNWISAGQFDEYVFLKDGDSWIPFESYKKISEVVSESNVYPRRKEFETIKVNNTIYARMSSTFPGFDVNYTSHKCILKLNDTAVNEKTTYTYIVGRKDVNGNPDFNHCSEEYTFTLYPETCKPRVYQTTDQQGFHWVEYQAWSAAAKTINERIIADCESDPNIIPVLINTGDMTQNGTRINEWLDYYNAGKSLFKHLEQMNVTGNNDLCGTDPTILGTGDDVGKSNGYYFHVFYCYEVDEREGFVPIINGDDNVDRYIPSLYYFDFSKHRFLMCNSEITFINCRDWFKKNYDANSVVNIYTGWTVPVSSTQGVTTYVDGFTTIYTILYNILNENKNGNNKKVIAACHEMPFTVITRGSMSIADNVASNSRSLNTSTSSLVGCHMNQMTARDTRGIYWFSRLLEYFNVKLCIGGHKHTYAVSHPVRELYYWDNENKNSLDNYNEIIMHNTLANDDLIWTNENYSAHLSKLPIINESDYTGYTDHTESGYIHPKTIDHNNSKQGVVYYMCQATGYKLTSNKELPSPYQEFAQLIPSTGKKADGSDSPDGNQRRPMFSIIDFDVNEKDFSIALIRIENILTSKFVFSQTTHGTDELVCKYAVVKTDGDKKFCDWRELDNVSYIITV